MGVSSALSQTFGYVFSRLYVIRHQNAFWRLLLVSHLYMGLASLLLLPLVWTDNIPPLRNYLIPLLGTASFYVAAQGGLFVMMRLTNPSRVAPLLGTKIVILAVLSTSFFGHSLSPLQWMAVAACFGAVLTLNFSGGSLPVRALILLVATCTGYSLSDLNIHRLVQALAPLPTLHAATWGCLASYVLLGAAAAIIAPLAGLRTLFDDSRLSLPFAALWLIAMLLLFVCIGLVGPILAIILQSTRGLMAVLLGLVLARRGWTTVEDHVPTRVFLQRVGAAILMILAVALYTA